MTENKQIATKVLRVMMDVKSIAKTGFNAFHRYKYVTDADIVAKIRASMIKNNLVCLPNQISCNTAGDICTLHIEYTLLDADSGEFIVSRVFGQGQDKGDKMVYKAATGAEKYFLLKTFLIPTDDDPENDSKDIKREESKGRNIGVRVPAGYWKMRENDPQGAQELLGGEGYFPMKTPTGYFIGTNRSEEADKAFVATLGQNADKKVLVGAPEPQKQALESPQSFISVDQRMELAKVVKERGIHHFTAKKQLKEKFGYEDTSKIPSSEYLKVYEFFSAFEAVAVGQ